MQPISFRYPPDPARVSIIIPVYRDLVGLKDTISSILACKVPPAFELEILVVNDGADQPTSAYCSEMGLIEVQVSPNQGSYAGRNRGLEESRGTALGFVDADIIVSSDWICAAVDALREADYVAGAIKVMSEGVSRVVADYQQLIDFNTAWHMSTIGFGPTANVWMRRSTVEKLGGFNEALFSGGDMDFGIRVKEHPELVGRYEPSVEVSHPARDLKGLFKKSSRLAYGHTVIQSVDRFAGKFSVWNSVKRNLGSRDGVKRDIPLSVQVLRTLLYAHRLWLKAYYRIAAQPAEFEQTVRARPVVKRVENGQTLTRSS